MREEKLFRAIGDVGDDLIARADEPVQKKKPVRWAGIAALAACCLIAVGLATHRIPPRHWTRPRRRRR